MAGTSSQEYRIDPSWKFYNQLNGLTSGTYSAEDSLVRITDEEGQEAEVFSENPTSSDRQFWVASNWPTQIKTGYPAVDIAVVQSSHEIHVPDDFPEQAYGHNTTFQADFSATATTTLDRRVTEFTIDVSQLLTGAVVLLAPRFTTSNYITRATAIITGTLARAIQDNWKIKIGYKFEHAHPVGANYDGISFDFSFYAVTNFGLFSTRLVDSAPIETPQWARRSSEGGPHEE